MIRDVSGPLVLGTSRDPVVHTVGTCLFMGECGALTKATGVSLSTVCRMHLRSGSSSGKEETAVIRDKVLGRTPSPQACRLQHFPPTTPPSTGSASQGPTPSHPAGGSAESWLVREEESREVAGGP